MAFVVRALDGGGAERVLVAVARELHAAGIDVTLVLLCRGRHEDVALGGVRVVAFGARSPVLAAPAFARWLRRERPHAILSTLVAPNALAVATSRLLPERPRVVVREANTLSAALAFRSRPARLLASLAARAAYPRADAIVAVSRDARTDLARFLDVAPERVVAIPNPASAGDVRAPVAHPWLAEPRDVPVAVAAGRLVAKKGFDVLLDAIAQVDRARLVVLGEGPDRRSLEQRARSLGVAHRVDLPGFVAEAGAWFARADLFVLSSYAEGMPNALLEAMAAGAPVVATDCPSGPREILEDGAWGALVPCGDARALAAAIRASLAAPRSDRTKERAEAFAISRIAAAYARVLGVGDILTSHRPSASIAP